MTDKTPPDLGRTTGGIVEMLQDRVAELEAQLEAIGAGGVSGPLMCQPQEMPDLSALTERGAKAWAGVDAHGLREGVACAGSEPVAQAKGVFEFWWADHMPNATQAEAWREWCELMRPGPVAVTHPSPPEGMGGGWTKASQQLPPCRDDQLYIGVNTAGFVGVFNAVTDIAGDVHCHYETAEECIDVMSNLDIWQPFTPPTSSADSRKGGRQ